MKPDLPLPTGKSIKDGFKKQAPLAFDLMRTILEDVRTELEETNRDLRWAREEVNSLEGVEGKEDDLSSANRHLLDLSRHRLSVSRFAADISDKVLKFSKDIVFFDEDKLREAKKLRASGLDIQRHRPDLKAKRQQANSARAKVDLKAIG